VAYAYDRLFRVIIDSAQADGSIGNRMASVLSECEAQLAHPDWTQFKALDYSADAETMSRWLDLALSGESFEDDFQGLWFGLTNPVRNGVATADLYAGATPSFDSDNIDWALSPTVNPDQCELESNVLSSIYQLAYGSDNGLGNDAEYPLALAYGSMASCEVLGRFLPGPGFRDLRGAAAGFDSGDFLILGEFVNGRFRKRIVAG
jgi:hypothetical protein